MLLNMTVTLFIIYKCNTIKYKCNTIKYDCNTIYYI